jgi:glycine cleavage system H protein
LEIAMIKFTKDHEWVRLDGDEATIGITPYAQEKLGDLVFIELPAVGAQLDQGATAATVESVKAASDVYAPISGTVTAVNDKVTSEPALVNSDAAGEGWLFRVKVANKSQLDALMDETAYKATLD